MNSFTVHPTTEAQEKALKAVLEALEVPYEEELPGDPTAHLLSTTANRQALEESIKQAEAGNLTTVSINDLWK